MLKRSENRQKFSLNAKGEVHENTVREIGCNRTCYDIKEQMATLRDLLGQLEYLVYQCDDRVEIEFFKGGVHDKTGSKE